MKLILFGAPGSGKGTQAVSLSTEFSIPRISLGDILREEVKKETELGRQVKGFMERGELVPDEIVGRVVEVNLPTEGFILDGYPRNISQALYLERILGKRNSELDAAIFLETEDQTVIDRLQYRRVCVQCGALYHLINLKPRNDELCDKCNVPLVRRKDDTLDVIKKRLEVYRQDSKPLVEFYQQREKLVMVEGNGSIEEVGSNLKLLLKSGNYIDS